MKFSVEGFRTTTVYFGLYALGSTVSSEQSPQQVRKRGLLPLIFGLWPTGCGFLPSKVLNGIIVPRKP
jgi:hypothetical protein